MGRQLLAILAVNFMMTGVTGEALAYCLPPSAPSVPEAYDRPVVPRCFRDYPYTGKHTCENAEIDIYRNDAQRYVDKFALYADAVGRYVQEAAEYTKCELDFVANQTKR